MQKSTSIAVIAFILVMVSCQTKDKAKAFSLKEQTPTVIKAEGNEIHQYWEFKNDTILWGSTLGKANHLMAYRDSLKMILGTKTLREKIEKESTQSSVVALFDSVNGDQYNSQMIHSGKMGLIRPINFLEAELLNYQLERYPLLSHPTEFHTFILFQDSTDLVRVYFAASDQPWPPKSNEIFAAISKDLKHGWNVKYDLHNHYEPVTNGYLGILAPSMADAQMFSWIGADFNLEAALITNGFHTVEVKNSEFAILRAHGE